VPTTEAHVAEIMAGIHRAAAAAGAPPAEKPAATADIPRQILGPIPHDMVGLRSRAAVGRHPGRAPRDPASAACVSTLLRSKGEPAGRGVTVALRYGSASPRSRDPARADKATRCSSLATTGDFPPMPHPSESVPTADRKTSPLVNQSESA